MMNGTGSGSGCDFDSGLSQAKRQRALTPKGKEKIEETTIEEKAICGICLLGGGLKVRGLIDCCDHYFCFICIMEWARVESRCPMCKQRFHYIRRPEVPGLFMSESVLEIPVRNQVYHPLGNESSTLSDPYADINCRVCHASNNDELLLLCDLCDSASHTFCVGLGYTVPEDNWYCHDCIILREEGAKIDGDTDLRDQNQGTNEDQQQPVSVLEIVADERVFSTEQMPSQQTNEMSPSTHSKTQQRVFEGPMLTEEQSECASLTDLGSKSHLQLSGIKQTARTLRHSRNIHVRIQAFRKNWNALRSGDLIFSSVLDSKDDKAFGAEQRANIANSDLSPQSKSPTLINNEQLTDSNLSRNMSSHNDLHDINKAWKMMQKAKTPNATLNNSSLKLVSKPKMLAAKLVGDNTSGTYKQFPIQIAPERQEPIGFCQKVLSSNQSQHAAKTPSSMQIPSFKKNRVLTKGFVGSVKRVLPIQPSSNNVSETTSSSFSRTTHEVGGKSVWARHTSELPQDMRAAASKYNDRSSLKWNGVLDDKAKSEIQSMVKLNLMLQSKGRSLGTTRFKEIARASTHSILAACGLKHSKSYVRRFSNQICRHAGAVQQFHASTLMPGSCRDCFDSFVKDVVSSILLENLTSNIPR